MTIGAPIAPVPATLPATPPAAVPPPTLEERVAELSVYAESGDPVAEGEIWYVEKTAPIFGEDGIGFDDLLDIINPLQHIPVVGTIYRAITGDTIESGPRVMGGALFGGVIGFAAALVNAVIDEATGSDIGDKALALFTGDTAGGGDATAVVNAAPAATPIASAAAATPAAAAVPAIESSRPAPSNPALAAFLADRGAKSNPAIAVKTPDTQAAQNGQIPPSEALIRARSAVPIARKAAALGFGGAPARPTALPQPAAVAATPSGSNPPSIGKADRPVAKPSFPSAVSNHPARYTAAAHQTATALSAAKSAPNPAPERTGAHPGATPGDMGSVPMLMQQALEKYEVLMQARSNPTLEDEI